MVACKVSSKQKQSKEIILDTEITLETQPLI